MLSTLMMRRSKNERGPAVSGRMAASTQARALRTISRLRLLDQRGVEPICKVTVLQAPAGYGKTECLTQWRAALHFRGIRSTLVRLERADDDLQQFLTAMRAALGHLRLDAPELPPTDTQDREAFCQTTFSLIANVLGATKRPIVILIDDVHWIGSDEARRTVELLFRSTPDHVRFVLATRYKPMLSLARLAAAGQLARIPGQSLLFTPEETHFGLQERASHEAALQIQALTSGWPALIDLIVSDGEFPGVLSDLRRGVVPRAVAEFFQRIVSGIAPPAARDCVTVGAISERFDPALAGLMLGRDDVEALLDAAVQSGMPLLVGDDTKTLAYPTALRLWLLSKLAAESTTVRDLDQLACRLDTDVVRRQLIDIVSQIDEYARSALTAQPLQEAAPKDGESQALSPRERDVLDLIARGMSRREIAEFLKISESSVKCHQGTLFRKLRAARRSDAIQQGKRLGFL